MIQIGGTVNLRIVTGTIRRLGGKVEQEGHLTGTLRNRHVEPWTVDAGAVGVLGYCAGAIFFGKPCRFVLTDFIDGLVYGLLTGAVFAWLWPGAEAAVG